VPGPEQVLDLAVVARALIDILDQHADRRAGRTTFEHAGKYPHLVGFFALGSVP